MLQNLHVKNLALIDECEVEFEDGLNILSGETGAGKSIIIGSINLALGEKVPKEILRDDSESAFVELVFYVESEDTLNKLKALDIEIEDNTVILSRKITAQRAIGRVNGEAVSVSKMKEVASYLIDIHGQHEGQSLLSTKKHLEILDEYAGSNLSSIKEQLKITYKEYKSLKEEYAGSALDSEERARELSFLSYEIKEIEEADLKVGEDEELEKDFRRFSNGKKIAECLNASYMVTGSEDGNASEQIGRAVRELSQVSSYDDKILDLENQLAEIDNLLSDFNHDLSGYLDSMEFDEENFFEIEKRLDLINHLKSKYGSTIEEVLDACKTKSDRVEVLNDYDSYLTNLKKKLEAKEAELIKLSQQVSDIRIASSKKLCATIEESLKELNFLDVKFAMEFNRIEGYTANGFDDAQFIISTNPGEALKPLSKIASGGEMSRIMLAIKTVMAANDHIESLIFDEIDSGISGRTAQMVSEKMNTLARNHQIICITHLPQIAAMADTHFLIEKSVENASTVSNIHRLDKEESITELARMLGGVAITEAVMQNAREMKELASQKK